MTAAKIRKPRRRPPVEAKCEGKSVAYAARRGCVHYKLNSLGRRGKDDHVFVTPNGCVLWVEFKREDESPKMLQAIEHARLVARHQMHAVVRAFDEFAFKLDWAMRLPVRRMPRGW